VSPIFESFYIREILKKKNRKKFRNFSKVEEAKKEHVYGEISDDSEFDDDDDTEDSDASPRGNSSYAQRLAEQEKRLAAAAGGSNLNT
jgi:hypothetical protein